MCSFTPFATTAAILANSMTLVGIALDRYLAIVKYINGSWNPNTLLCVSWAIFVWGLASGIASPMLSSFYLIEFYVILTDPTNSTNEIGYQSSCSCMGDKVCFNLWKYRFVKLNSSAYQFNKITAGK